MNWGRERYVRVYTRDTEEWCSWEPETRAVFMLLMRVADRTGEVTFGSEKGLANLLRTRVEWVQGALAELIGGPLERTDRGVLIRNFTAAQEAVSDEALRKRQERDRKRADSREPVTLSRTVQDSPGQSEVVPDAVTPCCAVPSVPCCAVPEDLSSPAAPAPSEAPTAKAKKQRALDPGLLDLIALHRSLGGTVANERDRGLGVNFSKTKHLGLEALRAIVTRAAADRLSGFGPAGELAWILAHPDRFTATAPAKKPTDRVAEASTRALLALPSIGGGE